ncbi:hypothetical protein SAMN05216304_10916 [Bosea sp. OK403]|uniref:hypothetical protein n=1 Tax=Bosea sp. OK403 TaxID=1855286 RepID=UPI0008E38679|nr:hypothetical protein [Bosea sp. OK403]SFJ51765.1 hypothetical protein SAMN05216304_10916 [Bosea sp. OK403]
MPEMDLTRRRLMGSAPSAAFLAPGIGFASLARAQAGARLRIGLAAPNTTLDPHLQSSAKQATRAMDNDKRAKLLAEVNEIVFADRAILPLHHEGLTWAAKKSIGYTPRADQYTLAMNFTTSS